jgi:hypothetical protein
MKAIKGLGLFAGISILISSCFEPPEFSDEPKIGFESITFGETPDPSDPDSLLLVINFKDGDGDLGIDASNPAFNVYPYHVYNFYLANDGEISAIPSARLPDTSMVVDVLDFLGNDGLLVTSETASDPNYDEDVPPFSGNTDCYYKTASTLYVRVNDVEHIPLANRGATVQIGNASYVKVEGIVYRTENENHYNIIVRIFEKTGNGPNDFQQIYFGPDCVPDFRGQFPILTKEDENAPLAGILKYSMYSVGIIPILNLKQFWFEIVVKDQALHTTQPLKTKVYTLDELRR